MKYYVTTFYQFIKLNDLEKIKSDLIDAAQKYSVKGLLILGGEGFNTTCCAQSNEDLILYKNWFKEYFKLPNLFFKDSISEKSPFKRYTVKIREEIVTIGAPDLFPNLEKNHHLSPKEWNRVLKEEKDVVLIDTRNWYETKIGTFKNAIDPKIDVFTQFPEFVDQQNIPKDKKMLIFCTGGIRCEKGIYELQRRGYENVYQLEGGIINYIKEYPNDQFEGECFVFDQRVALDQNLEPSKKYGLCPHCGQPSEIKICCKRCDHEQLICVDCHKLDFKKDTCSKHCAYQFEKYPDRKGPRQVPSYNIEKHENSD